jgi:hypothetical protein
MFHLHVPSPCSICPSLAPFSLRLVWDAPLCVLGSMIDGEANAALGFKEAKKSGKRKVKAVQRQYVRRAKTPDKTPLMGMRRWSVAAFLLVFCFCACFGRTTGLVVFVFFFIIIFFFLLLLFSIYHFISLFSHRLYLYPPPLCFASWNAKLWLSLFRLSSPRSIFQFKSVCSGVQLGFLHLHATD